MYTVEKLIEELQQFPKDMKVAINHNISEDQAMLMRVEKHNFDTVPYSGGDNIFAFGHIPYEEEVLFLEGGN